MMKNIIFYIIQLLFLLQGINSVFAQYPSFRIHPSSNYQIEPLIVRHPSNHQIMFCSSFNVFPLTSFRNEGVYVTTNGGQTWFGSDSCTGVPITNHGGDPGPVIDKDGRFLLTHLGFSQPGMWANYSTNLGATWSNNYQIITGDLDKGSPTTDGNSLSPYYGRTYLAWTRFSSPFPVVFSYTSNGGVNWSSVQQVNNSVGGHQSIGANIVTGPNGNIYVTWASVRLNFPFNEDFIGFASSSNAGGNWSVQETAIDIEGIKAQAYLPWRIRVNSYPGIDADNTGGQRNGWIYIATTERNHAPAGTDPDIVFFRSTNGGVSWSSGTRVNQDVINNGKVQYFPAVRVDENGGVNIVYYDNRNSVGSQDSTMEVYLSRSVDGGNTWNDYLVSNHKFVPKSISGADAGNQGDNIGMTSGNGKLWPVWMSNFSGHYQIWTAMIDYNTIGVINISSEVPSSFELKQNYPNPFNPSTKIHFLVPPSKGAKGMIDVNLVVYDTQGKEVRNLVNEELNPGTYEVTFDGTGLASGVYYYRLQTNDFIQTKAMVMVK